MSDIKYKRSYTKTHPFLKLTVEVEMSILYLVKIKVNNNVVMEYNVSPHLLKPAMEELHNKLVALKWTKEE